MKISYEGIVGFFTSTLLTFITYLLGGWNSALQTLLIMIALDYITGILKAVYQKKLNSEVGLKGIIKKVGYLVVVMLANFLDKAIGDTGAIHTLVIYFFVANEGLSITENWVAMGLPMPSVIKDALEQLKAKSEKKGDDTHGE